MQDLFSDAVEFLRERLHQAFTLGCQVTAPSIVTSEPEPELSWWDMTKAELLLGDDLLVNQDGSKNTNKKRTVETVLDNSYAVFEEDGTPHATRNILLPAVRKVMGNLIAFEIIGVQPLTGMVGRINTLRVTYADEPADSAEMADLKNEISRLTKELVALKPETIAPPEDVQVQSNRLSIQILKEVVEVSTKKLCARWAFNDSLSHLIHDECITALAQEICAELDQDLLQKLHAISGEPTSTFDMSAVGYPEGTFVGDIHAALAILINRQCNLIATRTRRGAGNWSIVSPTALTILQSATTSAFARRGQGTPELSFYNPTVKYVGVLNNAHRVYVDQYAPDSTPVLVGYRGNDIDAAAFYCPYQPLLNGGVTIDQQTFEPVCSFNSRAGFLALNNSLNTLGNSADYLGRVGINTSSLSFL